MANTNSPFVTNIVSSGAWHQLASNEGGRVRTIAGNFELVAADFDAVDDTITLAVLPTHARPLSILIGSDDLDTGITLDFDLGTYLWTPPATLGAALDDNIFANAITDFQTATRLTEFIDQVGALATANIGDRMWEWSGLASDPGGFEAIVLTQDAASAGAASLTMSFVILYATD